MKLHILVPVFVVIVACGSPQVSSMTTVVGPSDLLISCSNETGEAASVSITRVASTFELTATLAGDDELLKVSGLRPALNVRIEDGPSEYRREFIDFNDAGLEVVPVDGPRRLELDLNAGAGRFVYELGSTHVELDCAIDSRELTTFLEVTPKRLLPAKGVKAVAFDIDDTLLFTSPAFTRGFATGGLPKPGDILFWTHTNDCDAGCAESSITLADGTAKVLPANAPSTPKTKAMELINYHRALGHEVYAITARPDINGEPLRVYLASAMGIDRDHVFFEPDLDQDGNPAGKTDRIESLDLDVFYGDSDSDITDARKAFTGPDGTRSKLVKAIRFLRSPKSSNRKAGKLNKYHPGYFGEPILADSY